MEGQIRKLKLLIEEYEEARQELREMIFRWEEYDDPGSDPGLQYSQAEICEELYNQIKEFAQQL